MRTSTVYLSHVVLACAGALACQSGSKDEDGDDGEAAFCAEVPEPGPSPIRRLTQVEYNNTVYQLFGDNSQPANQFPADEEAGGFDNQADVLVVSPLLAEHYLTAAEELGAKHAPTMLEQMPGCQAGSLDESQCMADAEAFIMSFGKRALRRPVTEEELPIYLDLFLQGTALGSEPYSPTTGVELVIAAMLQSPSFLYRVEFGMPDPISDDVVELTSYEIASRLSYLLWNTMPDDLLLEAADADLLRDPAEIERQVRRMLDTPRAREAVKNFFRQWLSLDDMVPRITANGKNLDIYPDYYEGLPVLWQAEAEHFFDHAIFEEDANLEALLTAPYTMMNEELADFYGISGPTGIEFVRVELDPTKYSGFMTQPGLLAYYAKPDRSSPIHRGKHVREHLLCQSPPPPPDNVPEPPNVDETKTTKEQFAQHSEDPVCAGCHAMMDPIGFGFEHFDGLGRYRELEWNLPIDASGQLTSTDVDGPFNGVTELAALLASSEQVKNCVVSQWFRFGYGRFETELDECTVGQLRGAFAAANYDIKELIVALTQTEAFRYRHASTGE